MMDAVLFGTPPERRKQRESVYALSGLRKRTILVTWYASTLVSVRRRSCLLSVGRRFRFWKGAGRTKDRMLSVGELALDEACVIARAAQVPSDASPEILRARLDVARTTALRLADSLRRALGEETPGPSFSEGRRSSGTPFAAWTPTSTPFGASPPPPNRTTTTTSTPPTSTPPTSTPPTSTPLPTSTPHPTSTPPPTFTPGRDESSDDDDDDWESPEETAVIPALEHHQSLYALDARRAASKVGRAVYLFGERLYGVVDADFREMEGGARLTESPMHITAKHLENFRKRLRLASSGKIAKRLEACAGAVHASNVASNRVSSGDFDELRDLLDLALTASREQWIKRCEKNVSSLTSL